MLVDDVNMVFRQGVKPAFGLGEGRGVVDVRGLEARGAQPVCVVRAVDAAMVVLSEDAGPFFGIKIYYIYYKYILGFLSKNLVTAKEANFERNVSISFLLVINKSLQVY